MGYYNSINAFLKKSLLLGSLSIPALYRRDFFNNLDFENVKRLKYLSVFGLFILSFYVVSDFLNPRFDFYLFQDMFLWLVNLITVIYCYKRTPFKSNNIEAHHIHFIRIYAFILINWTAYVASFEFMVMGQIYSYLMGIFLVSIIMDFNSIIMVVLLTSGFSTFIFSNFINYDFFIPDDKLPFILITNVLCAFLSRKFHSEKKKVFMTNVRITNSNIQLNEEIKRREETEEELKALTTHLEERIKQRTSELENEVFERKNTLVALEESKEALNRNNQELQKLNEELDLFVYRTSHDIRGPISSVFGLLMLIKNTEDGDLVMLLLEKIEKSMLQLDSFIEDIIEFSENTKLPVHNNTINFYTITEEILAKLETKYPESNIEVNIEVINPEPFISDEKRLRVILRNIIQNAFMFHLPARENKHINIKINTQSNSNHVQINVVDNGIGIKKTDLLKVFTMFYRASDKSKGAGIGLYITKLAVEKLKGTIDIDSESNMYTNVNIILPNQKGPITDYTNTSSESIRIFNSN